MLKVSKMQNWDEKKRTSDIQRTKVNEKRRNLNHRKNAGIWEPSNSITAPTWFLNIYESWNSYSNYSPQEAWSKWKRVQLNNSGVDREPKKSPGRPPLKDSERKTPLVKTGRAEKMKKVLLDNGIHTTEGNLDYDQSEIYLLEHPTVQLLKNGRLQLHNGTRISVYQFIKDYLVT